MNIKNNKSIAKRTIDSIVIESDFYVLISKNTSSLDENFYREVSKNYIQFHFCVQGFGIYNFNGGNYTLPIQTDQTLLLYNPEKDLPIDLKVEAGSSFVFSYFN